jgi:excisionase family DNA binding protein
MDSKQSFSTSEVARFCHVTPDTVRKWAEAGRIPVFKTPGGHRRIRRDDLVQFLRENGIPMGDELRADGTRVLVVDDEQSIVIVIQRFLEHYGPQFQVSSAMDGFDAGHQVGLFQPSVVFLDLRLPGIDGFEVCRRIKASPATAATKIIAMTGLADADVNDRIVGLGAATCLKKPFSPDDLRKALQLVGVDVH